MEQTGKEQKHVWEEVKADVEREHRSNSHVWCMHHAPPTLSPALRSAKVPSPSSSLLHVPLGKEDSLLFVLLLPGA